jgi:serine/threonine protein kinase
VTRHIRATSSRNCDGACPLTNDIIGSYRITAKLGFDDTGEVYCARSNTKLDCDLRVSQNIAYILLGQLPLKNGLQMSSGLSYIMRTSIAIKVLPPSFARDPERLALRARKAKVLASLNHPNIAQIYGIEDRALAIEL